MTNRLFRAVWVSHCGNTTFRYAFVQFPHIYDWFYHCMSPSVIFWYLLNALCIYNSASYGLWVSCFGGLSNARQFPKFSIRVWPAGELEQYWEPSARIKNGLPPLWLDGSEVNTTGNICLVAGAHPLPNQDLPAFQYSSPRFETYDCDRDDNCGASKRPTTGKQNTRASFQQ